MVGNQTNNLQVVAVDLAKWLAGFIEITNGRVPTTEEWNNIVKKVSGAMGTQLPLADESPAKATVEEAVPDHKTAPAVDQDEISRLIKDYLQKEGTKTNPVQHPYWPYPRQHEPWDTATSPYWLRDITVD